MNPVNEEIAKRVFTYGVGAQAYMVVLSPFTGRVVTRVLLGFTCLLGKKDTAKSTLAYSPNRP